MTCMQSVLIWLICKGFFNTVAIDIIMIQHHARTVLRNNYSASATYVLVMPILYVNNHSFVIQNIKLKISTQS